VLTAALSKKKQIKKFTLSRSAGGRGRLAGLVL
jgi:hypothetical protein